MQGLVNASRNQSDKSVLLCHDKPFFSLIWLHGLGDKPSGFQSFFQHYQGSPVFAGARIKLLHAPLRPVTINGGSICTSWYDIRDLSGTAQDAFSIEELRETLAIIDAHVKEEVTYWKLHGVQLSDQEICQRVFLGGFSQGCAASLCYGLTADRLIGGVIGFSGHLIESIPLKNKEKLPLLVYHGDEDRVLEWKWVEPQYARQLKGLPNFKFKLMKGVGHTVQEQQLQEMTEWMTGLLKQRGLKPHS